MTAAGLDDVDGASSGGIEDPAQPGADDEGFGAYLRRERRNRAMDLEDVQQATKIRFHYLVALEDEDLERLPAPAFVRSYLKAYARCVGADADRAVALYEAASGEAVGGPTTARASAVERPSVMTWIRRLGLVVGVVAFAVLVARTGFLETLRVSPEEPAEKPLTKKERVAQLKRALDVGPEAWERAPAEAAPFGPEPAAPGGGGPGPAAEAPDGGGPGPAAEAPDGGGPGPAAEAPDSGGPGPAAGLQIAAALGRPLGLPMTTALDRAVGSAVKTLAAKLGGAPEVAVILGSGLTGASERWPGGAALDLRACAGLPIPRVKGHAPVLVEATLGGRRACFVEGRVHLYEGHSAGEVAAMVRVLAGLGCPRLVVTCASGALAPDIAPGDLVGIADHMNLTGANPLGGADFVPMAGAYRADLYPKGLRRAVLAGLRGPSYETAAEAEMLRRLGADIVSMSTVLEVIAARAAGIEVAGLSIATNRAGGGDGVPESHEQVVARAAAARERLWEALGDIVGPWRLRG